MDAVRNIHEDMSPENPTPSFDVISLSIDSNAIPTHPLIPSKGNQKKKITLFLST